jgi:hypothetical protein
MVQKETLDMIAEELKRTGSSLVPTQELVYVTCKGRTIFTFSFYGTGIAEPLMFFSI